MALKRQERWKGAVCVSARMRNSHVSGGSPQAPILHLRALRPAIPLLPAGRAEVCRSDAGLTFSKGSVLHAKSGRAPAIFAFQWHQHLSKRKQCRKLWDAPPASHLVVEAELNGAVWND